MTRPRDEGRFTTPAKLSAYAAAREATHAALQAEVDARACVDRMAATLARAMRLPPRDHDGRWHRPPSDAPLLAAITDTAMHQETTR